MAENVTLSSKEGEVIRKTLLRLAAYDYELVRLVAAERSEGMTEQEFGLFWSKLFPALLIKGTN